MAGATREFKLMTRHTVLSILILLFGACSIGTASFNTQVGTMGRYLAKWSTRHQTTIRINGKPINVVDPMTTVYSLRADGSCIGATSVCWQVDPVRLARNESERADIELYNQRIRENLQSVVKSSHWCVKGLLDYLRDFEDSGTVESVIPDKLAEELKCLGELEFSAVMGD